MSNLATLATTAEWYAANGVPVFPLWPKAKTPMTKNGVLDATTDLKQVKEEHWRAVRCRL